MCIKNLNSYGCGHNYREISSCGDNCIPEAGYKFIREYDCSACKAAGVHNRRGRDGLGRHGQALTRQQNKEEAQSVTGPVIDSTGEVSPWAQSLNEKAADSRLRPGRRRRDADEAWEHEHKTRMDDLCSRAESMSLRSDVTPTPGSSRPTTANSRSSYRRSPSPADPYSSTDDENRLSTRSRSDGPRFGEVMSVADITAMRTRSRRHHHHLHNHHHHHPQRSNYDSQDSLDSIFPKVVTSASGRAAPRKPDYSLGSPDSGYASHGPRSHRSHGSRAGSYAYSTSPQSHIYQPPMHSGKATAAPVPAPQYAYQPSYYGVEHAPIGFPRYLTY